MCLLRKAVSDPYWWFSIYVSHLSLLLHFLEIDFFLHSCNCCWPGLVCSLTKETHKARVLNILRYPVSNVAFSWLFFPMCHFV